MEDEDAYVSSVGWNGKGDILVAGNSRFDFIYLFIYFFLCVFFVSSVGWNGKGDILVAGNSRFVIFFLLFFFLFFFSLFFLCVLCHLWGGMGKEIFLLLGIASLIFYFYFYFYFYFFFFFFFFFDYIHLSFNVQSLF